MAGKQAKMLLIGICSEYLFCSVCRVSHMVCSGMPSASLAFRYTVSHSTLPTI